MTCSRLEFPSNRFEAPRGSARVRVSSPLPQRKLPTSSCRASGAHILFRFPGSGSASHPPSTTFVSPRPPKRPSRRRLCPVGVRGVARSVLSRKIVCLGASPHFDRREVPRLPALSLMKTEAFLTQSSCPQLFRVSSSEFERRPYTRYDSVRRDQLIKVSQSNAGDLRHSPENPLL